MNNNLSLDDKLWSNFIDILSCTDNTLRKNYKDNPDYNSDKEVPYITLEYYAYLLFITKVINTVTDYHSEKLIHLINTELSERAQYCFRLLKNNNYPTPSTWESFSLSRTGSYNAICFGDFVPVGYYLLNDYPRYTNELQDGLLRCSVALGDFSLRYIKTDKMASFQDIHSIFLLDFLEMPFYSDIFITLSNNFAKYFSLSISTILDFRRNNVHKDGIHKEITHSAKSIDKEVSDEQVSRIKKRCLIGMIAIPAIYVLFTIGTGFFLKHNNPEPTNDKIVATDSTKESLEETKEAVVEEINTKPKLNPYKLPSNGHLFLRTFTDSSNKLCGELEILTDDNSDSNYVILLKDPLSGAKRVSFFVRAGQNVVMDIPLGIYKLYYASGHTWYGYDNLFGDETVYAKANTMLDFSLSENSISGYSVTLYPVSNGNLDTSTISADEFLK